jgi:hypothetical protein
MVGSHFHQTSVRNPIGAPVGDRVRLSVEPGTLLSRLALNNLLPVAMMLMGEVGGDADTTVLILILSK